MTDGTILVLALAALFSIILMVVIWQVAASWRARAVLVREDAYKDLAERAVATQETTGTRIGDLGAELTTIRERLAAIEKALTVID